MVLTAKTIICYCFFQLCLTSIYTNIGTGRTYVYKDTLKLPLSTISWIITAVKSIDILTGFLVGQASDATRTRWGRRKPYLAFAWPLGIGAILLMVAGAEFFQTSKPEIPCQGLVPDDTSNTSACNALKECYETNYLAGNLLLPNSSATVLPGATDERTDASIETYFFFVFLGFFTFIPSGSQIPYDALGQELTDDYEERAKLFMWKPLYNLVGAILGSQLLSFVSGWHEDNLAYAALLTFEIMSVLFVLAYVLLLCGVKERPPAPRRAAAKPLAVSISRLLSVRPYRLYLLMRIPMTFLGLLPYQILLFYVQNNMELETVSTLFGNVQLIAIAGALISTPLMMIAARKWGRRPVLTGVLAATGSLFIIAFFIPFNKIPSLMYIVGPFLGCCIAAPYVIPDAMLGDIIDYDELLTGERNEAMYSMVETNVQQVVEIILGVATMCMALAGFDNLAGCECGCGVSCKKLVGYDVRWVCPGSIGYSCDGAVEEPLFFQPEPEIAPCAVQNDSVKWVTALFMFGLPGICGILAIFPIRLAVITKEQHEQIMQGIVTLRNDPTASVKDPLAGGIVRRPVDTEASLLAEHFSVWEWALAQRGKAMSKLRGYLGARLLLYAAVAVGFIVANASVSNDALKQISFWALAFLIILVPLDWLRLLAACRAPPTPLITSMEISSKYPDSSAVNDDRL